MKLREMKYIEKYHRYFSQHKREEANNVNAMLGDRQRNCTRQNYDRD